MKKTNNKGFSLVELIIVIAIMAILAGAIAPALIKYIDKSRKSNDVSSAKTIKTAVETALGTEDVYEFLTGLASSSDYVFTVTPGATSASTALSDLTSATVPTGYNTSTQMLVADIQTAIFSNIGEKAPKLKFKKKIDGKLNQAPTNFYVSVSNKGTVAVYVGNAKPTGTDIASETGNGSTWVQLAPEVSSAYQ